MPKHTMGSLKNLGGYAARNTKKARLSIVQAKETEGVQVSLQQETALVFGF